MYDNLYLFKIAKEESASDFASRNALSIGAGAGMGALLDGGILGSAIIPSSVPTIPRKIIGAGLGAAGGAFGAYVAEKEMDRDGWLGRHPILATTVAPGLLAPGAITGYLAR